MKKLILIITLAIGFTVQGQIFAVVASGQTTIVPLGTPVLSNFNIDNTNLDRVNFDSSNDITGMTTTGFVVSGKTISSVTIDGDGLGGYFTVSVDFDFWDNNTIRLGENDDITNSQATLYNFTLEHIINNIIEPAFVGTEYFVDGSIGVSGVGTTEATAFKTIQEGVDSAIAGDKVWIKAFDYGDVSISTVITGTVSSPIFFEGYKVSIGGVPTPITSNYYEAYSDADDLTSASLLTTEMPTITQVDRNTGSGWALTSSYQYNIFKNIQITGCNTGIGGLGGYNNHIFQRVNIKDLGTSSTSDSGNGFRLDNALSSDNNRIIDCNLVNIAHRAYGVSGNFNLIQNSNAYCDETGVGVVSLESDYYIYVTKSNNIIKDNLVDRRADDGFGGHGFNIRKDSEHNLVDNNVSINIAGAFVARHDGSRYNVFKNNESHANVSYRRFTGSQPAGMNVQGGGSYNIWENNYIHHTRGAISMTANTEQGSNSNAGIGNIWRNNLIHDVTRVINIRNVNTTISSENSGNKIHSNTIIQSDNLFNVINDGSGLTITGNEFKNNIVSNVTSLYDASGLAITGYVYDYNNFYNGFAGQGTNFTTDNPLLVDTLLEDFRLSSISPTSVSEGGIDLFNKYDFNEVERVIPFRLGYNTDITGTYVAPPLNPYPVYQSNGGFVTSTNSFTIDVPYPGTINNNDVLIMVHFYGQTGSTTTPVGWNLLQSDTRSSAMHYAIYWQRADGTETGNVTITGAQDTVNLKYGIIFRFDNCLESGTPYEVLSSNTIENTVGQTLSLGNSLGDTRLAVIINMVDDNLAYTNDSIGYSEIFTVQSSEGTDGSLMLDTQEIEDSSTSDGSVTKTAGSSDYNAQVGFYLIPKI